ncbi:hypothetical protein ACFVFS_22240 [Kitasatospora sp. NPDC057692]|uniref:hypothetical protein n=1 Tax=Kitasatospora sp. NPDC057692 TaxID=3346215 RepID=UPI0036A0E5C4
MVNRFIKALGATVLVTVAVIASPGVANASAGGSTSTALGTLSQYTVGDSYHVGRVEAGVASGYRCDIGFMVTGTLKNGQGYSSAKWASCSSNPSYTFTINQEFKADTRLCVSVRTRAGSWLPDKACIWIEA